MDVTLNSAIQPDNFSIFHSDRAAASVESKVRGFLVNNSWCTEVERISSSRSSDMEFLMLKC